MAKLNEHNLDSIRRRYNQQNRELALENAALRQQKRLMEQEIRFLKEYVFELWRATDCSMDLDLADVETDIRSLVRRAMEAKRRREPILSPIPENKLSPRYSLSPGTPPVVASLPEGLETPTKAIPEQSSVNVESRRRRKDGSKAKKFSVFESPPRDRSKELNAITAISWLLEATTPPSKKNRSPMKDIPLENDSVQTDLAIAVKKIPKRQRTPSRTSTDEIAIPNARPKKATGSKRKSVSATPEMPNPTTKDTLISPARPALSNKSVNMNSPTKPCRRRKSKCKSETSTPPSTTSTPLAATTTTSKSIITPASPVTNKTRTRRAGNTPVSYKEPNLVSKMRRPSAALVDAVPSSTTGLNGNSRNSISENSDGDVFVLKSEH